MPRRSRDDGTLAWRRPVLAIAAVTSVTVLLMGLTEMEPRLTLVFALGALIGMLVWLAVVLGSRATAAEPWVAPHATEPLATRSHSQVMTLRWRIANGRNDASAERLYATLVDLVDEQLVAAHGVDRQTDPDAARAILGDDLFRFVADPESARALARPRAVERVVARIEAI